MFSNRLTSLQIMILCESRFLEGKLKKGELVFTKTLSKEVFKTYDENSSPKPSRQAMWNAIDTLHRTGLLFVAPPCKKTSKRVVMPTYQCLSLFDYPVDFHPYRTPSSG